MKPKISTGYLTPQAQRKKNAAKGRLSDKKENPSEPVIDANILSALMKCPEKKKEILQLLAAHKNDIEKYKENTAKSVASSSLHKLKNKKRACESPTALLRRRALEQMTTSPTNSDTNTNRSNSNKSEISRSSSRCSEESSKHSGSAVSFSKVLDGVIAYVEIRNKDQDRSSGAKAILKSMGAELRETFSNDVTHVIFKDGSFMTYQKAKLMKIHLVSILWVEFCRKTMKRQLEKQYPALKSGFLDNETSMICSQMQKEYEDIIRDEYRKSIMHGTPLPSTRSLIDRRRTLMTPSVSNLNSSTSSFQTAVDGLSSQEVSDREVAAINGFPPENELVDNEGLVLNDPECFSEVSGPMVNGSTVEKRYKRNSISNCILKSVDSSDSIKSDDIHSEKHNAKADSDMELTMMLDSNKTPKIKASKNDIYNEKTPKLPVAKITSTNLFDRRKTICNSLLSSDISTTSLISCDKSKNLSNLQSSDKSTNVTENASFAVPKCDKKSKRSSSSLFGSNESLVFGRNKAKSRKVPSAELDKTASAISELHLSSDKDTSKKSSAMSSLQISSDKESERAKSLTRRSSSMSRLWVSSEQKTSEKSPAKSVLMADLVLSSGNSSQNRHSNVSSIKASLGVSDKIVDKSAMSSLQISSENNRKLSDKSSMSSLLVSAESTRSGRKSSDKHSKNRTLNSDPDPSLMSCLHLSSEKVSGKSLKTPKDRSSNKIGSFSPDEGDSGTIKNLVENVIKNLNTPDKRKSDQSSISLERSLMDSDDSEVLSSNKHFRTLIRQGNREETNLDNSSNSSDDSLLNTREIELLSSVTLRRKTLGPRRGTKFDAKAHKKDSPIDTNKVLVVNIVKSPLTTNIPYKEVNLESKECASLNTRRSRRTFGKEINTNTSKTPESKPCKKSGKELNKNRKSENARKQIITGDKSGKNHSKKATSASSESDSAQNKSKTDDSSDSTKSGKKLRRKLYNPDDSIPVLVDDEQERKEKRSEVRKRKSDEGIFINPVEILKSSDKRRKNSSHNKSISSESSCDDIESPPKRTRNGNKKDLKLKSLNSSADEQKELLNEIINRNNKKEVVPKTPKSEAKNNRKSKRKTPQVQTPAETPSRRRSTRIIKPAFAVIESQKKDLNSDVAVTSENRRSTLDFQPVSSSKKPKKADKMKLSTIVCTKLHKSDVQVFSQIIKKLGRFAIEDEVSQRTTHLVAGEPKRTINMLRAISRGCWVLKFEWVLQSLESGKWLREEDFEVHDFSPAVKKCRLERQAFGPTYTLDVFESCPPIYVAPSTNPRCSDLKELITTCRGRIVTTPRMAKIIVGDYLCQEDTVCVNETWVLDCITFNKKVAPKKQYLLENDQNKRKSLIV